MANRSKIYVDVVVDDKGTTKRLAVDAKAAALALKEQSIGAHSVDRRLKGAAQASANGTKNFSKMAQGITGGLVPAYATLAANLFAVSAAFQFLKNAAQFKLLEEAQSSYFATTGNNLRAISRDLQEASNGFLNFEQAAQAAAVGAAKGFTTADLTSLTEGALVASAALGRSFQDSFDRLLRGVSKAEPELLDELGIILRLETATRKFAVANNVAVKSLTAYERGRAVLEEVQRQLDDNFGAINTADVKNPFEELAVTFDEIVKKFSQAILPVFEAFASIINNSAYAAIAVFGLFGLSIAKAAFPLEEMGDIMEEFDLKTQAFEQNFTEGLDRVQAEIRQTKADFEGMTAGSSMNVQRFATKQGNKSGSKILQKAAVDPASLTKKDKAQLARSLKAAEAQYKKFGKIKTGIFKGASMEELTLFKKDLKIMDQQKVRFFQRIKMGWQNAGANAKLYGVGVRKTLGGLVGFAGKIGKGIGGALSRGIAMAGIFGMITLVVQAFTYLFKNIYSITVRILGFVDKFLQSGIGQGFASIVGGLMDGIAMFIKYITSSFTSMLSLIGEGIAKVFDFLGKDELAAGIRKIADTPKKVADAAVAGLEAAANTLRDASTGEGESLVSKFASSDVGEYFKGIEDGAAASDKRQKALDREKEKIKELTEALADFNKKRAERDKPLTAFQTEMSQNRVVATSGVSERLGGLTSLDNSELLLERESIQALLDQFATASPEMKVFAETFKNLGTDNLASGLQAMIPALKKQEESSQKLVANYQDYNQQLERSAEFMPDAFGSVDGLDKIINQLERTKKALVDTADGSDVVAEKLTTAFSDATGQELEDTLVLLQGFRREFDRIQEQSNILDQADVNVNRLTGFSKENTQEMLALKRMENELDGVNLQIALARADLKNAGEDQDKIDAIQDRIDALMQEKTILTDRVDIAKEDLTLMGQLGDTIGNSLQSSMQSAFQGLVEGTMTAKQAFASMAQSILKDIAAMITKMLVLKMLEASLGGTSFGNFLGIGNPATKTTSAAGSGPSSVPGFRYGGIVSEYSTGGIAKGPNAGYPAVLHGTEAVVPLPNGKSIPVDMHGAGQNNNVTVNVSMDSNGNAQSQASGQDQQGLGQAVAAAVQKELQNQKRAGGILSPHGAT